MSWILGGSNVSQEDLRTNLRSQQRLSQKTLKRILVGSLVDFWKDLRRILGAFCDLRRILVRSLEDFGLVLEGSNMFLGLIKVIKFNDLQTLHS